MIPTERPLDNPINWSFRVGRLWSIDIRVHVFFLIAAIVLVWMEIPNADSRQPWTLGQVMVDALGVYAMLFFIVLVHELGHCYGARRTGGEASEILLWPLGGLAYVNPPHNAKSHLLTALAGPAVNVLFCLLCAGILTVWVGSIGAVPWNPLHPTTPIDAGVYPTTGQAWVMRFFGISYFLLLINMLPIFPFDGGRVVQAWLWPSKGYRSSMEIATSTGMIGAILVGLFGLFTQESWLILMIAVFGYITCWQTRRQVRELAELGEGEFGYDFSRGYASFEQSEPTPRRPGYLARRRIRKAALRAEQERREREHHQQLVEQILGKISKSGMDSLTEHERQVLHAETQRHRSLNSDSNEFHI
jgi:Zn-dependent protease